MPQSRTVLHACKYWRGVFKRLTDGNLKEWGSKICDELLLRTGRSLDLFIMHLECLSRDLDHVCDGLRKLLAGAERADPSGEEGIYGVTMWLVKDADDICNVVGELVVLRRDGVNCLQDSFKDRQLFFQVM